MIYNGHMEQAQVAQRKTALNIEWWKIDGNMALKMSLLLRTNGNNNVAQSVYSSIVIICWISIGRHSCHCHRQSFFCQTHIRLHTTVILTKETVQWPVFGLNSGWKNPVNCESIKVCVCFAYTAIRTDRILCRQSRWGNHDDKLEIRHETNLPIAYYYLHVCKLVQFTMIYHCGCPLLQSIYYATSSASLLLNIHTSMFSAGYAVCWTEMILPRNNSFPFQPTQ